MIPKMLLTKTRLCYSIRFQMIVMSMMWIQHVMYSSAGIIENMIPIKIANL